MRLNKTIVFVMLAIVNCVAHSFTISNYFEVDEYDNKPAIVMKGFVVNKNTAKNFNKIVIDNPDIKTVVFEESIGGSSDVAMHIGAIIRIKKMNTITTGSCESACALMWLGGVDRSIEQGGYLGYHPTTYFADPFGLIPTFGEKTKKARDHDLVYFYAMGIPARHKDAYNKGSYAETIKVYDNPELDEKCISKKTKVINKSTVIFKCVDD